MYLIRDVFRCKPGKSRAVAEKFAKTIPVMETLDGFSRAQVMLDFVAGYWTVVLHSEVENLTKFETHMMAFSTRPEVRSALEGYMDMVEEGHREIFRILQ